MKFVIRLPFIDGTSSKIDYNFGNDTLPSHIDNISKAFQRAGIQLPDPIANYCLESTKSHIFDTKSPLASQLAECDSQVLLFVVKPDIRATRTIDIINSRDNLKESLFRLRTQLLDYNFAQAFVAKDGMKVLFDVLMDSHGNTQSYCLGALCNIINHLQGMNVLLNSQENLKYLYSLVHSNTLSVCRQTLELLISACTFDEKAGIKIYDAAKSIANEKDEVPFQFLVKLVSSGDLDTQVNSLTLINTLLQTAAEEQRKEMQDYLEDQLSLRDILKGCVNIENEKFNNQLQFYENLTGQSVLVYTNEDIKRQLKEYQLQQPLFNIIRNELQRAQKAIEESLEAGQYLPSSAEEPLARYSERKATLDLEFTDRSAITGSSLAEQAEIEEKRKLEEELQNTKLLVETLKSKINALTAESKARSNTAPTSEESELLKLKNDALNAIEKLRKEKAELKTLKQRKVPGEFSPERAIAKEIETDILEERRSIEAERSKINEERNILVEERQKLEQERNQWIEKENEYKSQITSLEDQIIEQEDLFKEKEILHEEELLQLNDLLESKEISLNLMQEELEGSKQNIQKLSQIIKVMKSKYDLLKEQFENENEPGKEI